jgi:hypothetical protein
LENKIAVAVQFVLSTEERDEIVRGIVRDTPQLRQAAEAVQPGAQLRIEVVPTPKGAYVADMRMVHSASSDVILLTVPPDAANELISNAQAAHSSRRTHTGLREILERVDADDWQRMRETGGRVEYILRRPGQVSRDVVSRIRNIAQKAETFEEFESDVEALDAEAMHNAEGYQLKPLSSPLITFGGEQAIVPPYVHETIEGLRKLTVLYLRERREPIGQEEAMKLLRLKMRRGGPERLSSIQGTVAGLLGVQIDAFQRDEIRGRGEAAELDVDNFLAEVNGAGIREALRIVLDLEFERPAILLVEEPEIHLHPALETALMQYLRSISNDVQIFLSTHSTNFLDTAEMKNVYLVARRNGETVVENMAFDEAEVELPRELGIRLSSLFMFDRLIFVEGPTDEAVMRTLAGRLELNFSRANIGFITLGGARNFAHFAAEATMGFLSRRRVEMHFILDRDERGSAEVARMEELARENASVHVLEKRELENYLLSPVAVAAFIAQKRHLGGLDGSSPSPEEVSAALDECADELKELAIVKRAEARLCRPAYPQRAEEGRLDDAARQVHAILSKLSSDVSERASEVDEVVAQIRAEVEGVWGRAKLDIVPGDALLDAVCKRYEVRYRKGQGDGSRLAGGIDPKGLSRELVDLLQSIAA